ncbi:MULTISPECIES: class I SAM-dependent methyltransferase [Microcystis]|jgi:2-polyprenyl-3-methyl-5-hydroxy-6-metoxy-1,4-benzoquinol methylase|uniref:Methyltransferase domain-containing protein n=1 Tax=Microcystis aeruginosa PCC 9701 TaxID=721123 RepID=I4IQX9_MICAE|nr:class I SAM-dependent methyltransferase [Microcystis aeruginosa]CCI36703.1 hypothetical protein MICAK_2650003 [Microcystis aeruginosa PCC 9701]
MIKDYLVQLRNKLFGVNAVVDKMTEELKKLKTELKPESLALNSQFCQEISAVPSQDSMESLKLSSESLESLLFPKKTQEDEGKLTNSQIVRNHWSEQASPEKIRQRKYVCWMNHPFIEAEYINQKISGNHNDNWLMYMVKKYALNKLELGLSLGCGCGGLERYGIHSGICKKFEAFDIADGAIAIAQEQAEQDGISQKIIYQVKDINSISLDQGKYDIAFASASVHHIKELEYVFAQVSYALKPSSLFILNEFIGPAQFQWTEQQLELMNQLLALLPEKYKLDILSPTPNTLKEKVYRPTIEFMNSFDPSEAIRSDEIIPLLSKDFHIIEKIDYGGTILHILLQNIVGNFDAQSPEDIAILKLLCFIEETLITHKVISSDFALIVAQKKGEKM